MNIAGLLSRRKTKKQEYSVTRLWFNNKHFICALARFICHNLREWKRGSYNIMVAPIFSHPSHIVFELSPKGKTTDMITIKLNHALTNKEDIVKLR